MDGRGMTAAPPASAIIALRELPIAQRLLGLYEYGLDGCDRRSDEQVRAVIEELIGSLDFNFGDITEGFARVYGYCLRKVADGDFDRVAWILRELRDTWARALMEAPAGSPEPQRAELPDADVLSVSPSGEMALCVGRSFRSLFDASGTLARENGGWTCTTDAGTVDVPPTVQGLLHSRLDRLPAGARRLIQEAAVLGLATALLGTWVTLWALNNLALAVQKSLGNVIDLFGPRFRNAVFAVIVLSAILNGWFSLHPPLQLPFPPAGS